jgi:hypothetical protein
MSRTPIYQERGLRLPEKFTKSDREPDLCDTCARAKPTFSHTFTPQTRSKIRGKLWYFDVSGGGNLTPSLIEGNIYVYCFADSYSRKYFEYFTKNKDYSTTLRILDQFHKEVLLRVKLDIGNEMIFIQSDNGELNTEGVQAFTIREGIFQKFIHPYHPNMNGFIERAFRSMKDLARCMLLHAGLPDPPYWQKATSYALRLLDIMPNQSHSGWAREAYFLWYGIMFDYSRLRTWGSRCYALNHIVAKDFGSRSEPGIFVGMKPGVGITIEYEIFLPHKNTFITTGDVIFCEHVGRSEPERLLPPITMTTEKPLNPVDFQYLVDTVHYDEQEGVNYRVLRVYASKGLIVVDRELNDPHITKRRVTDTVHLGDALGMPIMAGKSNPKYGASSSTDKTVVATGSSSSESQAVRPISEETHQVKKGRPAKPPRAEEQRVNAPSAEESRYNLRYGTGNARRKDSNIEANLIETWIEGSTNWTAELNQLITLYSLDANPSISDANPLPQDGWTEP